MDEVVLIVKAPNQQIEDQTVHGQINWTVKILKEHLSEVYPSKPRFEDQKLIYSGQLLNDDSVLKDILRNYEGQNNHTVHLVCSPPRKNVKSSLSSEKRSTTMPTPPSAEPQQNTPPPVNTDGLRHRPVTAYTPPIPPSPFTVPPGTHAPPIWPVPGNYDPASVQQQMAWMQQAYTQYMSQYMQMMGAQAMGAQMPTNVAPPNVNVNDIPAAAAAAPRPFQVQEEAQNVDADDDVRINRDWLDWFYIMSRMMVMFSIVYFYSSPVRFFLVSTLGFIMYLYQIGFFRALQRLDQQDQHDEVPEMPPPTPNNNNETPTDMAPATPPPAAPAPSPLAITWAAFSSFFLSLIPEQPNVL